MNPLSYVLTFSPNLTTPVPTTVARQTTFQSAFTSPLVIRPSPPARHPPPRRPCRAVQSSPPPPVEFVFDNPRHAYMLRPHSPTAHNHSNPPILLYICGLGSDLFPQCQAINLRPYFTILSLALTPTTDSQWQHIIPYTLSQIDRLRANSGRPITIVAESFGALFAMRLVANAPPDTFSKQYLINPATALLQDSLLIQIIKLLPLLRVDPTRRLLYNAVSFLFFNAFIADQSRLSASSFASNNSLFPTVDTQRVPLSALLHRLQLITDGLPIIDDHFIHHRLLIPTTLIASGRDRLLQSSREIRRLAHVFPNVENQILLPASSHAVLFERHVDFSRIIFNNKNLHNVVYIRNHDDWQHISFSTAAQIGKDYCAPWRKLTNPKVYGQHNVQQAVSIANQRNSPRPVLFVGNHGIHGILDTPLLFVELADIIGDRVIRPLADPIHFKEYATISGGRWKNFIEDLGAVKATAKNFCQLLSDSDMILLFPGGGREVCRRRGEQNTIFWNEKANFVRMAAKYNAIIVPFSTIGADDAVDILIDGDELKRLPWIGERIQRFLEERNIPSEHVTPLTTLPRPERFYFKFHKYVDTEDLDPSDRDSGLKMFRDLKQIVQQGIYDLIASRQNGGKETRHSKTMTYVGERYLGKETRNSLGTNLFSALRTEDVMSNFVNPPLL